MQKEKSKICNKTDTQKEKSRKRKQSGTEKAKCQERKARKNLNASRVSVFKNAIHEGPYYICVVCHRCLYKKSCLLYTSPSPRDGLLSRMPSSA